MCILCARRGAAALCVGRPRGAVVRRPSITSFGAGGLGFVRLLPMRLRAVFAKLSADPAEQRLEAPRCARRQRREQVAQRVTARLTPLPEKPATQQNEQVLARERQQSPELSVGRRRRQPAGRRRTETQPPEPEKQQSQSPAMRQHRATQCRSPAGRP
jgi:hypothetical protein